MTDYTLPTGLLAQTETVSLIAATAQFNQRREREREGEYWRLANTYLPKTTDAEGELRGVLAALRGMDNRLTLHLESNPSQGAFGGTPQVDGNQPRGNRTLNIKNATALVSNWIRSGDFFALQSSGTWELKMSTADTSTAADGTATLDFVPALRNTAVSNTSIVTANPLGTFVLANPAKWLKEPGKPIAVTLQLEEVHE